MNTFAARIGSQVGRRSRTNSIGTRQVRDSTDSSASRESGASLASAKAVRGEGSLAKSSDVSGSLKTNHDYDSGARPPTPQSGPSSPQLLNTDPDADIEGSREPSKDTIAGDMPAEAKQQVPGERIKGDELFKVTQVYNISRP
jgi:hypothetical protein